MCHARSSALQVAAGRAREGGPRHRGRCGTKALALFRTTRLPSIAIPAGLLCALLANAAQSSDRTVILNYICATYESARRVALEQSWRNAERMPDDCRTLYQRPFDLRAAVIHRIVEIVPIGRDRWIEIGRVHRGPDEFGYSAGIVETLFLF